MPELPEVETIRRCIKPHLVGHTFTGVIVRNPSLRWPVPDDLGSRLHGQTVHAVQRRGKYLLLACDNGTLIVHLGMSGQLLVRESGTPPAKHDHVDLLLSNGKILRLNDSRRFGAVLWTAGEPSRHPLLADLGPEPLDRGFSAGYLYRCSRQRRLAVKMFVMDSHVVVGIGNIYANEALFAAGIHPARPAAAISRQRYGRLCQAIREVLTDAIAQGGTTVRDFCDSSGNAGHFQVRLRVYDRAEQPCFNCGSPIRLTRLGQRATYFCPHCQR